MNEHDLMAARYYLNNYWPKKDSTSIVKTNIGNGKYDLTVIIPCYNEEKYIEQCVDSVRGQISRYQIKIVIIDDGSTDDTANILRKYENQPNILIIHQKNAGHSAARNRGLKEIESKYVYFVDGDDYLLENSLEGMLDEAIKYQVDIMEAPMMNLIDSQMIQKNVFSKDIKEVRSEELTGYVGGKLISSEMFRKVCFPERFLYEDSILPYLIYPRCRRRMMHYNQAVYVYRVNSEGITVKSQGEREAVDTYWITELMLEDMSKIGIKMNQDIYKLLLNQVALNYIRTANQEETVKVAIYILTVGWFEKLYIQFKTDSKFQSILEKALSIPDYSLYKEGCAILWKKMVYNQLL